MTKTQSSLPTVSPYRLIKDEIWLLTIKLASNPLLADVCLAFSSHIHIHTYRLQAYFTKKGDECLVRQHG